MSDRRESRLELLEWILILAGTSLAVTVWCSRYLQAESVKSVTILHGATLVILTGVVGLGLWMLLGLAITRREYFGELRGAERELLEAKQETRGGADLESAEGQRLKAATQRVEEIEHWIREEEVNAFRASRRLALGLLLGLALLSSLALTIGMRSLDTDLAKLVLVDGLRVQPDKRLNLAILAVFLGGLALIVAGLRGAGLRRKVIVSAGLAMTITGGAFGIDIVVRSPDIEIPLKVAVNPEAVLQLLISSTPKLELIGWSPPFDSGSVELATCDFLSSWRETLRRPDIVGLVLIGHADQRTFRGRNGGGIRTNGQLAQRRAEVVKHCLEAEEAIAFHGLPVTILASGPLNFGLDLDESALQEDRRVGAYALFADPVEDDLVLSASIKGSLEG